MAKPRGSTPSCSAGLDGDRQHHHGGRLVRHRLRQADGQQEEAGQQLVGPIRADQLDQLGGQVLAGAAAVHGRAERQQGPDQHEGLPLDLRVGLVRRDAARQHHDERATQHSHRQRRELEGGGDDGQDEDRHGQRRARDVVARRLHATEDVEQVAPLERRHVVGGTLQQQHVAQAQAGGAHRLGQPPGAMDGQHLQAVAFLELEIAQAAPDQRRARQQHAFDDRQLLRIDLGIGVQRVGLELQTRPVLDLEQIGALALHDQVVAGRQLEIAQALVAAHGLLSAQHLDHFESGAIGELGVGQRLADQRAVLLDHHIGLVQAFADFLLAPSGPHARGSGACRSSTCRAGPRPRSGCRPVPARTCPSAPAGSARAAR